MVLDLAEPNSDEQSEPHLWRLPSLGDRLAAVVVDFGVLALASSLLIAPITRQLYISREIGDRADIAILYLLSAFLFLLAGIAYQTLCLWRQGATVGQKAFKIRVVNLWDGEKPSFMTALTRSIFWWLDTILLGLPHLAVFSNPQRRPMHDRLADTIVTSVGKNILGPPVKTVWVHVGKVAVVLAFVLATVGIGWDLSGRFRQISALEDWQEELSTAPTDECTEVTDAKESWPDDSSRLMIAMTLFSAEMVGNDCLETEAYRAFKSNQELDLAYLTRAFTRNEDADLSDAYLDKVCEVSPEDSESCMFSDLIETWTEKNWTAATDIFMKLLPHSHAYVKIWAVKHFERTKDFDRELNLIEQLGPRKALAGFLGTHRAIALWGLHRKDEARVALSTTIENMDSVDRVSLASWFCYRELLDNCSSATETACTALNDDVNSNSEFLAQANIAVALIRLEECRPGQEPNYESLLDRMPAPEAAQLISAGKALHQKNTAEAVEILRHLSQADVEHAYASDAQMRLVQILDKEKDLTGLVSEWNEMDPSVWEWRRLGRGLFDRFVTLGMNSQAFDLGQKILSNDPQDHELFKNVVVAGFKAGFKKEAWSLLQTNSMVSPRAPASVDTFTDIETKLRDEFVVRGK